MNTLSLWLSLVLAATLCGRAVGEKSNELDSHEYDNLEATVHVARQAKDKQLAVYLAIDNHYQHTIECGGQLLTAIAKDSKTVNLLVRFGNLQVFPSGAFSYPLVYLVADQLALPEGYVFVAQDYPTIKANCRSWSYTQYLHPRFCRQSAVEMCSGDKVSYSYMIDEYWIGSCQC